VADAERTFFELDRADPAELSRRPPGARFRNPETGMVSVVYREIVVRFRPGTDQATVDRLCQRHGLAVKRVNTWTPDQMVLSDPDYRRAGLDLFEICNRLGEADEVDFATPNFVSEYGRAGATTPPAVADDQWHLSLIRAPEAWAMTVGAPKVVVAVLDDGVDLRHPALRKRLWRNPDKAAPDRHGRDFFVKEGIPDHFDPSPKVGEVPFESAQLNDLHGTQCAGLVAADGIRPGTAPRCRILPVKVFHASRFAANEHVANAIRWAGLHADVLSCSWFGGAAFDDISFALEDLARARQDLGAPALFATANHGHAKVRFPASDPNAIAVGALNRAGKRASYSNFGPELAVVAPGGEAHDGLWTTDLSAAGRGRNPGEVGAPVDAGGHYTGRFFGTSAATPVAAGVVALMLSANPRLDRKAVAEVLRDTARKVGDPGDYDASGRHPELGFGLVDAAAAVERARSLR
jgi:subtilisin family serine protease